MIPTFTIYSLFFLVTTLVAFFGAFLTWQRRMVKGAVELMWLMIASGIGAFWIIVETVAPTVTEKLFWTKLEFTGGSFVPALYLIFVLRFTGKDKFLSSKHIISLLIVPLVTLLLIFTNEKHNLIWTGNSAISTETNLMEYYHGIGFWVGYIVYSYILLMIATIDIFIFIFRHKRTFRNQGWIILVGGVLPWTASFFYLTGINITPGLDLTPASITLSGIVLIYAIVNTRFLDLVPIARETLVETLQDGILALDDQNRIQDVNEAALTYLGIHEKNVLGLPAGVSGASVIPLLNVIIEDNPADEVEIRNGDSVRTFRIIKQIIKNQPGSRLIVIRDISDQVLHKNKVLAAEEQYRKLFTMLRLMSDNMPDILWAKDLDRKFIFVNKALCENLLCVTDTEDPLGKTYSFFIEREREKYPDMPVWSVFGKKHHSSDLEVINSGKQICYGESGYLNGKFMFMDIRKAPIFDDNGMMIGIVGSGRDVTLQKETESDIHKRDILLDAIAKATALLLQNEDLEESILKVVGIIGKAAEVNRVYIFRNHYDKNFKFPLTTQILEWTDGLVEPQINNPDLQNIPYETTVPRWYDVLSNGGVILGKVCDFPESERPILDYQGIKSLLVAPIFVDNNFWGYIGFDDCSNEREWQTYEEQILSAAANTIGTAYLRKFNLNELIKAKEKAEESDRLKSAFLANMSHEIRTPMNGILGFTELLKEPRLTGEEQQEYIRIIEKSGARMLNIINDIISISTLETGLIKANISDVEVNELVEFIYKFFKPQAEDKRVLLILNNRIPAGQSQIKTDKEKVYAILTNLTRNAIKFTPSGSIELSICLESGNMKFSVKDTGIGVSTEQKEIIFERFRQGNESITRDYEGAGLGLSISKAYVELLGGKIWVESEPQIGSTFYFTIPAIFPS